MAASIWSSSAPDARTPVRMASKPAASGTGTPPTSSACTRTPSRRSAGSVARSKLVASTSNVTRCPVWVNAAPSKSKPMASGGQSCGVGSHRKRASGGFVAKLHLRRFVLWSLPVTYGAQRGRATMAISFKGAHFPPDIILMGVRWYLAYPLSYRHVEELLEERGVPIDHATIQRWVVKYSPLLEEAFHRRKRSVWVSWRMDETYIKVKGEWRYLYRAVDKHGQTIDFLLTEHRDTEAGPRFLKTLLLD